MRKVLCAIVMAALAPMALVSCAPTIASRIESLRFSEIVVKKTGQRTALASYELSNTSGNDICLVNSSGFYEIRVTDSDIRPTILESTDDSGRRNATARDGRIDYLTLKGGEKITKTEVYKMDRYHLFEATAANRKRNRALSGDRFQIKKYMIVADCVIESTDGKISVDHLRGIARRRDLGQIDPVIKSEWSKAFVLH